MPENVITNLGFSDEELRVLNELVRTHKVTISNEDLVLLMMGKRTTPLVDLTVKIGQAFERRQMELAGSPAPGQDATTTSSEQN